MRLLCFAASAILFGCNLSGFGQTDVVCGQPLNVPLHSRSALTVESRSAGLEFVATDSETLNVTCSSDDADISAHIHLKFSGSASDGKLTVDGSQVNQHGKLKIRIEVPK